MKIELTSHKSHNQLTLDYFVYPSKIEKRHKIIVIKIQTHIHNHDNQLPFIFHQLHNFSFCEIKKTDIFT